MKVKNADNTELMKENELLQSELGWYQVEWPMRQKELENAQSELQKLKNKQHRREREASAANNNDLNENGENSPRKRIKREPVPPEGEDQV